MLDLIYSENWCRIAGIVLTEVGCKTGSREVCFDHELVDAVVAFSGVHTSAKGQTWSQEDPSN